MRRIECSACKLKIRWSEYLETVFLCTVHLDMVVCVILFFAPVRFLNNLRHRGHCSLVHLKSISTWVQLQNECLPLHLSASMGLLGTTENTWWLLLEALFDGLAQLDSFLSRTLCISTSHCTSRTLALTTWWAGMLLLLLCIWNGMLAFFSGVGRIFVQDEGNWTAWVSSIWERKLILGRLKQLQLPWALPASVAQIVLDGSESTFCATGTSPSIVQSFWQGCFGSLLCLWGSGMVGILQALSWGNCRKGRGMILWLSH